MPFIIELDVDYPMDRETAVGREMAALSDQTNGFSNWIEFLGKTRGAIPCLQISNDLSILTAQIVAATELGRGVAVRVPRHSLAAIDVFCSLFSQVNYKDVIFIIDFEQCDYRYSTEVIRALSSVSRIRSILGRVPIVISSTSFPSGFKDVTQQEIFERSLFLEVLSQIERPQGLIYSDRGSARMPKDGGGGVPAPRIDLPSGTHWYFFRKDLDADATKEVRMAAYKEMADKAIRSPEWDPRLNIWGTQMIKLTQLGSEYGITSPVRSTSARINIHLFKQALRASPLPLSQLTEDDWSDL
jgi:hypothetical protein